MCMKDSDCPGGLCGQFAGDAYCAPDCSQGQACASDAVCTAVNSTEDVKGMLCIPRTNACPGETLDGGQGGSGGQGGGDAGPGGQGGTPDLGVTGGKLDVLNFAIAGDTRPPTEDDTSAYPTAVITKIWQDIQAANPRPAFAIATGDYQFANPNGSQSAPQLALYMGARKAYEGSLFAAMGNHECTGGTSSQCGTGNPDGVTTNYANFLSKFLEPINVTTPYYVVNIGSTTAGAWTAKFVFIAANAWTTAQGTWLTQTLAVPTTYTFVIRHESAETSDVNGVTASTPIIADAPYTLLIVGHTHTYEYRPSSKEVIIGNGGAPLSGTLNYGYVIARQRASDGAMVFTEYDYMTNAANQSFAVLANGTSTN
jgi:Calcineurin-like phosphoesterase